MCFLKAVRIVAITFFIAPIASFTNATPLVFNFTGTVSDQYLDEFMHDTPLSVPEWKGKSVSGSFIVDLNAVTPAAQYDYYTWYSTYDPTGAATEWLKFIVTNPDESTLTFPVGEPKTEGNSYFAGAVMNGDPWDISSFFNVARWTDYYENRVELNLGAIGPNSSLIYSSYDFNTIEFHPEFANEVNRGLVKYKNEFGEKIEYSFLINSITRVKSEVPESGSLILMLLGLSGLILNRRLMEK